MSGARVLTRMHAGEASIGPSPKPSATGKDRATDPVTGLVPLSATRPVIVHKTGAPVHGAVGRLA